MASTIEKNIEFRNGIIIANIDALANAGTYAIALPEDALNGLVQYQNSDGKVISGIMGFTKGLAVADAANTGDDPAPTITYATGVIAPVVSGPGVLELEVTTGGAYATAAVTSTFTPTNGVAVVAQAAAVIASGSARAIGLGLMGAFDDGADNVLTAGDKWTIAITNIGFESVFTAKTVDANGKVVTYPTITFTNNSGAAFTGKVLVAVTA